MNKEIRNRCYRAWKAHKGLVLFIALMLVFRSAIADWNEVPTGSMKPTILEGDCILVNKMAYDIRIPFTHVSLFKLSDPLRGDIVIFDSKVSDKRLVKRVIGIPGDIVAMRDNVLRINGTELQYQDVAAGNQAVERWENLFDVSYFIRVQRGDNPLSSFASVKVPPNHYLVLGDNRNNSADSRAIGFVPRAEIVGRSRTVVLSFNYENFYIPRADRFFHRL